MKLSELKREKCKKCGALGKILREEIHGRDTCGALIDLNKPDEEYLPLSVFHNKRSTDHLMFCSWACVLAHLPKIKSDHFVALPYMLYDAKKPGLLGVWQSTFGTARNQYDYPASHFPVSEAGPTLIVGGNHYDGGDLRSL